MFYVIQSDQTLSNFYKILFFVPTERSNCWNNFDIVFLKISIWNKDWRILENIDIPIFDTTK